jgi:hypothetical protein
MNENRKDAVPVFDAAPVEPVIPAANVPKETKAKALKKNLGVEKLYENSRGEFFTELSYALNSEGGNSKKIKTH